MFIKLIVLTCITGALGVAFDTSEFRYLPLKELETKLEEARSISTLLKQNIALEKAANMAVRKMMRKVPKGEFSEILSEHSLEGTGVVYWRGVLESLNVALDGETA